MFTKDMEFNLNYFSMHLNRIKKNNVKFEIDECGIRRNIFSKINKDKTFEISAFSKCRNFFVLAEDNFESLIMK
nr:hypothetical protein 1634Bnrm3_p139 [Cryptomonas sp.]